MQQSLFVALGYRILRVKSTSNAAAIDLHFNLKA